MPAYFPTRPDPFVELYRRAVQVRLEYRSDDRKERILVILSLASTFPVLPSREHQEGTVKVKNQWLNRLIHHSRHPLDQKD